MSLTPLDVSSSSVRIRPAAASTVDHELSPSTGLIGQRHALTESSLLLDVLVDRALIDLAGDIKSWHVQRDTQRDKMMGLGVG